ncbi:unnamed protein product [Adineta steineri]|uniref:Uncharacterized protein n=1 Tax=Adineta steineri TaxID=433720 RepID=A0A815BWW6_9BILA|nr:unnamed protein product [Adineta steineri]CAF3579440.1 unnamed protein product [Adineta steineri]
MTSIDSKLSPCKDSIQTTIHQPLLIRTNKHRCFIFCIGHTSLTCVPGIGKKNEYLLNQFGIHDLSMLYSKYRLINNYQDFKQWLQNEIGFTSYQAKMTTCAISSKLGEIKEINTGLLPLCCTKKGRRKEKYKLFSNDKNISKRNRCTISDNEIEQIKLEKLSSSSNQDRLENSRSVDILNNEETFTSSSINKSIEPQLNIDNKDIELLDSENNLNHEKPSKIQTNTNVIVQHSTSPIDDQSSSSSHILINESHDKQQLDIDTTKEEIDQSAESIILMDHNKTIQDSSSKNKKTMLHSNFDNPSHSKHNLEIFTSPKQKVQSTLDVLQDFDEYSTKSIPHSTQSNDISQLNTDILPTTLKQQQQQESFQRLLITDKHINTDHLQQKQSIQTSNSLIPTNTFSTINACITAELEVKQETLSSNISSETLEMTLSNEKKSLSILSPLSDSKQSLDRINSFINTTQIHSDRINQDEKPTTNKSILPSDSEYLTQRSSLTTLTSTSSNIIQLPEELNQRSSLTNLTKTPVTSRNSIHQLFSLQNIHENQITTGPSSLAPCHALWDNISNEKIVLKYKNYSFTSMKKKKTDQKINHKDYNQNYHSSTTLLTFIARQQYLRERQTLNEHILYSKPT